MINKLREYKEQSGSTWREMEDQTGISATSLINLYNIKDAVGILRIKLSTYVIVKDKLGVDLLEGLINNE
jgi:hypothetical protein